MRKPKVAYHAKSVYDIDPRFFQMQNIRALVVDLDNTLEPSDCFIPSERALKLRDEIESLSIRFIIVSNNRRKRVAPYCERMNVPYLPFALKYFGFKIKRFLKSLNLDVKDCLFVGDQIFTDKIYTDRIRGRLILTEPITDKDNWQTRYIRRLDKIIRARWKEKNLLGIECPRRKED